MRGITPIPIKKRPRKFKIEHNVLADKVYNVKKVPVIEEKNNKFYFD